MQSVGDVLKWKNARDLSQNVGVLGVRQENAGDDVEREQDELDDWLGRTYVADEWGDGVGKATERCCTEDCRERDRG